MNSSPRPLPENATGSDAPNPVAAPRHRINPWKLFHGAMVPNWLLVRTEVSQGAKLCYARLAQYAGERNDCRPKQATLAAELGVCERTAHDYLQELQKHGLVEPERRGLGKSNRYHFLDNAWMRSGSDTQSLAAPEPQEPTVPEPQNSSGPVHKENQKKRIKGYTSSRTAPEPSLPTTEAEAVDWAAPCGVPPDLARQEFSRLVAVDWLDGCGRPVRRWREYIKSRWSREQSEIAERAVHPAVPRSRPGGEARAKISSRDFAGTSI